MNSKRSAGRFWLVLTIFSLAGQVAWTVENMYFNVFIYKMFHATAAEISLMVGASAAAAALTTLLIGALSDKVGKRKVFICGGYVLWGVTIASFALIRLDVIGPLLPSTVSAAAVGVSLTILMDCVMTFVGSSANDACFNAWLTESVAPGQRGAAEGVNAMMPLLAVLVVFGGFMGFDLDQPDSWSTIFLIIGGAAILIGGAGFFLMEEHAAPRPENSRFLANLVHGFRPSVIRANPMLYATLVCFMAFNISIQIFMPYLILYYTEALHMDGYVLIMAPAIVLAAVFTAVYGRRYDRRGFAAALIPSLALLMGGYVILYLLRDTAAVFLGSLMMMCGYLSGMAVFGAKVRDHIPADKAGMFQGLRIISQVLIPGIIGPAIGAWVLCDAQTVVGDDGTRSFIPNEKIFLAALVAAALIWLLLPLLRRLRTAQKEETT